MKIRLAGFCKQPLFYGIIYLVMIPLFASLFCYYSRGFYYPYVKVEAEYGTATEQVRAMLERNIREAVKVTWPSSPFRDSTHNLRVTDVRSMDGDRVSMNIYITYSHIDLGNNQFIEKSVGGEYVGCRSASGRIDNRELLSFRYVGETKVPDESLGYFGPQAAYPEVFWSRFGDISLNSKDSTIWKSWGNAFDGFADGIPGRFGRMLYLSSITITTVGYGDIVPITTTTRVLTGIEAILGIIIIGLFINSVGSMRD